MRRARSAVQAELVLKVMAKPVREMHQVNVAPNEKLIAEVEAILRGVCDFGADQVGEERGRQLQSAATVRTALAARKKRDPLGVYADATVADFTNQLTARTAAAALDWRRNPGSLTTGEVVRKVEEELDGQSDKWIDGTASKGTNEAFADGREAGYEEYADQISAVIYSALLDINTCENCAAADGDEGATPDDIPDAPNPDCDGGDKCRCVHVYVFSDEVRQ